MKTDEKNTTSDEVLGGSLELGDATRPETLHGPEGLRDASVLAADGVDALTILDPDATQKEKNDAEAR